MKRSFKTYKEHIQRRCSSENKFWLSKEAEHMPKSAKVAIYIMPLGKRNCCFLFLRNPIQNFVTYGGKKKSCSGI
jgi:hypothetical protein